jgi:hypothetical protein
MISETTKGKTKMAKKANSNLLKEAIADARAVRETALKNAEIAIQEALTPRLQSIISRKIQAEMEEEDDDVEVIEGEDVDVADFDDEMEIEEDESFDDEIEIDDEYDVVDMDVTETFADPDDDVTGSYYDVTEEEDVELDMDEMDLEEIIRELEDELENDDEMDFDIEDTNESDDEELDIELEDDDMDFEDSDDDDDMNSDDEIDLDEILREMGYGDDEEEVTEEDEVEVSNTDELESELEEAYRTIRVLKTTINEVNLLNAKLLYANKVFRQYNLTTEQKRKIVESFDRTGTVREVKLVFATISESMKLTGTTKIKKITEGFASKTTKSTAPKGIINEDVDFGMSEFQKRNKELAGIIRK